jgi:hypothetical protein
MARLSKPRKVMLKSIGAVTYSSIATEKFLPMKCSPVKTQKKKR